MTDKQGKLLWLVCLSFGSETVTDENGNQRKKRRKVQRVAHGTLAEARKLAKELSAQYEHVDVTVSKERTFGDACVSWETSMRNASTATESAMNGYLINLGHMRSRIGNKVLTAITMQDIEDALASIKAERRISNTTLHKVYAVTKRVFKYAVNNDWLVRKPGFRDEIGFPGLCMHELRHTQATQLLGAGVDLKTVQARMGHAKASHTLDLYAHAIPANDRDAANIMGSLYNVPATPAPASEAPELDKSA